MKLKIIKKISLLLLTIFSSISLLAQEDSTNVKSIKPLRLGVKIGVPNIATINAEYVTPLLNNRVALAVDYMSLNKTIDETDISYNNFEIGTNIYVGSKGKGLYFGVSYFSFDAEATFTDTEFDSSTFEDGIGSIKFNTTNVKLGIKAGRVFYFRIEVGYGFGDIPEDIVVTTKDGSRTTTEDIPEIPGITSSGIPNFNFGIGFSFL